MQQENSSNSQPSTYSILKEFTRCRAIKSEVEKKDGDETLKLSFHVNLKQKIAELTKGAKQEMTEAIAEMEKAKKLLRSDGKEKKSRKDSSSSSSVSKAPKRKAKKTKKVQERKGKKVGLPSWISLQAEKSAA